MTFKRSIAVLGVLILTSGILIAQEKRDTSKDRRGGTKEAEATKNALSPDSLSKMARMNKKMEELFVYIPVPIISYAQETGNNFGLAKFNMIDFYKDDTITSPSKFSALATFSSLGNIKVILGWQIYLRNDEYLTSGILGYRFFPEYIAGIGNRPFNDERTNQDTIEQITNTAFIVAVSFAKQVIKDNFFGVGYTYRNYVEVTKDSTSFLADDNIAGSNGGLVSGLNLFYIYDNRKNRYTPSNGMYVELSTKINTPTLGSNFKYIDLSFDIRKYFKVFKKQVIALQTFWGSQSGEVPYFDLYKMGGANRMRGYYEGAIRDFNIFDAQVEYRVPLWKIFGMTGWVGVGKVFPEDDALNLNDLWTSYGLGLRIMVDSESETNLRLDFGFNEYGGYAVIINFSEAF